VLIQFGLNRAIQDVSGAVRLVTLAQGAIGMAGVPRLALDPMQPCATNAAKVE